MPTPRISNSHNRIHPKPYDCYHPTSDLVERILPKSLQPCGESRCCLLGILLDQVCVVIWASGDNHDQELFALFPEERNSLRIPQVCVSRAKVIYVNARILFVELLSWSVVLINHEDRTSERPVHIKIQIHTCPTNLSIAPEVYRWHERKIPLYLM